MRQEPDDFEPFDEPPSKSELKRQMQALQVLGQELTELPASRIKALDIPESLRDALKEYERTRSHEGRRRQLQFIGKLMRQTDPAPLREAVAAYKLGSAKETLALHEAEHWRDRLMSDDNALTIWLQAHPSTDVQHLRSLLRSARKDAQQLTEAGMPRHGKAYRELFQWVKAALNSAKAANADSDAEPDADTDEDEYL
ncbi:ribosome biogenesis factor YjgA [Ideonella paludis]|uniref:Dual-action ribosomal maturation protein DarP n=1 Tax=Ideonella paludis TaxID=1233411 RepID=A0ABS5DVX0_9BURK|nr:ribosome biogenesis factor YjgA [Ideonella paludis]MBQ0935001.1 DUF615 domain-containing protein [Ideonella paludis]